MNEAEDFRSKRIVRGHILFTIAVIFLLGVCWELRHVLQILYVSALFAVVLTPVVNRIQAFHIRTYKPGKPVAVLLLLAGIVIGLTLFFWIGLPPVLRDFTAFLSDLPHRIPLLVGKLKSFPLTSKLDLSRIAAEAQNSLGAAAAYVFTALPKWAAHLLDIVTAVILCVYFILEGNEVYEFFLSLMHQEKRDRLAKTMVTSEERVSKWLLGQLTLMAIVAVYSLIVFGALHVRYFVLFGILMGITNIIPIAGNLITITLVILVAASDSWTKALGVVIAYLIYTQLENAFLTPRIMKTSVDLMGGTAIAGIVGALVAVPSAAILVVFVTEYLVQKDAAAQNTIATSKTAITH